MNGYYSSRELDSLGFKQLGNDVKVSRKASIYTADKISLGNHVRVDDFCILSGEGEIQIGNYVHIAAYSAVYGGGGVIFENYSGLSPRCTVFSESDDFSGNSMVQPFFPKAFKPGYVSKEVVLRKFVQIGTHSSIMPGVELGMGVVIGAHSLVTATCEAWGIYAGVPAKFIKRRSERICELERKLFQ